MNDASLPSIELFDHAALFNVSKKTGVDEICRRGTLELRIALSFEHRLDRLLVGRGQGFQEIHLFLVKIRSLFRAQAAHVLLHQWNRGAAIGLEQMNRFDERAHEPLDDNPFALDEPAHRRKGAGGRKNLELDGACDDSPIMHG
jgi:hypothetical protein